MYLFIGFEIILFIFGYVVKKILIMYVWKYLIMYMFKYLIIDNVIIDLLYIFFFKEYIFFYISDFLKFIFV